MELLNILSFHKAVEAHLGGYDANGGRLMHFTHTREYLSTNSFHIYTQWIHLVVILLEYFGLKGHVWPMADSLHPNEKQFCKTLFVDLSLFDYPD